jgi:AcrR family transcriptional regulator
VSPSTFSRLRSADWRRDGYAMTIVMIRAVETATASKPDRRREVIDAARRVIRNQGLEATTLRKIGREAGFTTGVVTHYFPDKRAVIVSCFEAASYEFMGTVRRDLAAAGGVEERIAILATAAVPDDREARAEWRLWSEMWSYAAGDPEFRGVVVRTDAAWEEMIREVLVEGKRDGKLRADVDPVAEAGILARLIDGLGIRAWLSGDWAGARRLLVHHLASLGLSAPSRERA